MQAGTRIEVEVLAMGREGEAVALHDGYDVHVPALLVGERAAVRIEHVGRRVPERRPRAHARVLELLRPAPGRVTPPCFDHEAREGRCTGCPWMIASGDAQRAQKRTWLEAEFGLVVPPLVAGPSDVGYRWSSKRVARGQGPRLRLGSFRRDSHRLADMDHCLVDHPDVAAAAREVAEVATRLGIEAYDERTRRGDLRYVWLKTNGQGDVLVTLVTAARETRAAELAAALERPSGVAWAVQSGDGNALRGSDVTHLAGAETIVVVLAGRRVEVGPLGFLQPNPKVAERAYRELCTPAPEGLCFDLYAGAGVTTALLGDAGAEVLACEAFPESAAALGAAPETAEAFLERQLAAGAVPTLVVANPPRSGLGERVCDALVGLASRGLPELRIMSCSPAALRRDLDRLGAAFDLASLTAYDTLPHTPHVELVAKLHARRRPE